MIFANIFQIKAKNQLRVNGLSFPLYFLSYFIVLVGLMIFICTCILGTIFLFDVPSLQEVPALITLSTLLMLYCPSSILFSTCLSYIFDKMDSAQSILPNIATFFGLIPFLLVVFLDMLGLGKLRSSFPQRKWKQRALGRQLVIFFCEIILFLFGVLLKCLSLTGLGFQFLTHLQLDRTMCILLLGLI